MPSYTIWRRLGLVFLFIVLAMQPMPLLSLNTTNAYLHHICINNEGKSKSMNFDNSIKRFLKKLIDFMPAEYGYGFHADSNNGDGQDKIFGKLQCRGDILESKCNSCLLTASSSIIKKCPNNRGRIIWYDNCLIDLSSNYTYAEIDYRHIFYLHNAKDVSSDTNLFNKNTRTFLNKLKERTINKENIRFTREYMYATAEENFGKEKMYGMMQCTQDLSIKNCSVCLDWVVAKLPQCCNNKQGGRVLTPSCNFRYELYPFVKT
ncbi:unnamed protein product [Cochlearia groenlandica]